ncbi:MAG: DUF6065 family protein [Phycisphaerae bacterium]|nr:DUF6065 family protein [Phycisphaerae bacterium]MDW8262438.1 DUF6065 family protein [Phycisphaerales bacterium]
MIRFFKFRQDLFGPQPAREVYVKRPAGRGWPEECPPIRAANGFGYDILANFEVTFIRARRGWRVEPDIVIDSDFDYVASEGAAGAPLRQQYAWFWQKGQKLPHPISDNVYPAIANQVKISSFLFLKTDPNELLLVTDIPNLPRSFRVTSALIDTDWYPASYPWHAVIELSRDARRVKISRGEPICRLIPVRRDTYFAQAMSPDEFDAFFARGQQWLATHGKFEHEMATQGVADITRTYVRQQVKSRFLVLE